MKNREKQGFLDWTVSVTGKWEGCDLEWIRDAHPETIIDIIYNNQGRTDEFIALLKELLSHGSYQKAAVTARLLGNMHPGIGTEIKLRIDNNTLELLYRQNLMKIDRTPRKFSFDH